MAHLCCSPGTQLSPWRKWLRARVSSQGTSVKVTVGGHTCPCLGAPEVIWSLEKAWSWVLAQRRPFLPMPSLWLGTMAKSQAPCRLSVCPVVRGSLEPFAAENGAGTAVWLVPGDFTASPGARPASWTSCVGRVTLGWEADKALLCWPARTLPCPHPGPARTLARVTRSGWTRNNLESAGRPPGAASGGGRAARRPLYCEWPRAEQGWRRPGAAASSLPRIPPCRSGWWA